MCCEYLGNFLWAHNCLFCDLKPTVPSSPSQGDRLLKLFIDALILPAMEADQPDVTEFLVLPS